MNYCRYRVLKFESSTQLPVLPHSWEGKKGIGLQDINLKKAVTANMREVPKDP